MIQEIITDMTERSHKTVDAVKKELGHIRTGRASLSVLDDIRVDVYGQLMPINQLASLSVPEPRQILIQPWDHSVNGAVDKAIQKANLGLACNVDGKSLRIVFPELTQERRKEFARIAHGKAEEGRVAVRNIRRDANEACKKLFKQHELGEDDEKKALDQIQKITDEAIRAIDHALAEKEKEITEI